jgi:cytochrome subunit of sulfide dehydrogenase
VFLQACCFIFVTQFNIDKISICQHLNQGARMLKLNLSLAALLLASHTLAMALEPLPSAKATLAPVAQTSTNPAYLAANCANCHGTKGNAVGAMPSLAGLKASYISEQMRAFRDGKRPATIMHQLAKGYTDVQIDLIAGYFAAQTAK